MSAVYTRRRYALIDRQKQYRMLAHVLVNCFLVVSVSAALLFSPGFAWLSDPTLDIEARGRLAGDILTLHALFWPAMLVITCGVALHSFRWFLRFVGPLYRFVRIFEAVRDGNLGQRVTLRRGDLLTAEADVLNEMLETLEDHWTRMRDKSDDVAAAAEGLRAALPAAVAADPGVAGGLAALEEETAALRHLAGGRKSEPSASGPL